MVTRMTVEQELVRGLITEFRVSQYDHLQLHIRIDPYNLELPPTSPKY